MADFTRNGKSGRLGFLMATLILPLALTACVTPQPKAPAPESQSMVVREVVAEMKADAQINQPMPARSTTPPSRLVALSSLKVSAFSPAKMTPVLDAAPAWFQEPGLSNVEECAHCKAQGNIISSQYGKRRDPKRRSIYRKHQGIDIRAPQGSGALAFKGGVVTRASRYNAYGLTVEIRQYDGIVARYAHLSKINVKLGDEIEVGSKVGEVGRTGRTTGSHLHFELIKDGDSMDPMKFLVRSEQVIRCLKLENASK